MSDCEINLRKWAIEQARANLCVSGRALVKDLIADADDIYGFITGADASAKLRDIKGIVNR